MFRHRFPMAFALLPLLGLYVTSSPCYAYIATVAVLAWGYIGIGVQLIRGEAYDSFGMHVEAKRSRQPRAFWLRIIGYTLLWTMMHVLVAHPYVLARVSC